MRITYGGAWQIMMVMLLPFVTIGIDRFKRNIPQKTSSFRRPQRPAIFFAPNSLMDLFIDDQKSAGCLRAYLDYTYPRGTGGFLFKERGLQ